LNVRLFWAKAGLGAASAPDFWKNMHEGDLTVHRSEITSLSNKDTVHLKSGISVQSDMIFACTGFEKPYRSFSEELRLELGLTYDEADAVKWAKLEAQGEEVVDQKLPILKEFSPENSETPPAPKDDDHLHGPSRHYRRLVPPSKAAQGDRSILFPGMIHSIFTPLIVETQALWGAAYMLGHLDVPSEEAMDKEVAIWNVWTRKRYLQQGRKHSYAIFDFLSVRIFFSTGNYMGANVTYSTLIPFAPTLVSKRHERATCFLKCLYDTSQATTTA
jgi:dimethylaniline monooxygenase (N-oxide forming)